MKKMKELLYNLFNLWLNTYVIIMSFVDCIIKDIHHWINLDSNNYIKYHRRDSHFGGGINSSTIDNKYDRMLEEFSNIKYWFFSNLKYRIQIGYSVNNKSVETVTFYNDGIHEIKIFDENESILFRNPFDETKHIVSDTEELYSKIKSALLNRDSPSKKEAIDDYFSGLPILTAIEHTLSKYKKITNQEIIIEI